MMQRDLALKWFDGERKKLGMKAAPSGISTTAASVEDKSKSNSSQQDKNPDFVLSQLESWKSKSLSILNVKKRKGKKKKLNQVATGFEQYDEGEGGQGTGTST